MTYQAIYKCRLCGKELCGTVIEERELEKAVCTFMKGKSTYKSDSGRNDVPHNVFHYCSNGTFGMADFQGFKAV